MPVQANHDHSIHVRQLQQVRAPVSDDTDRRGREYHRGIRCGRQGQIEPFHAIATGVFVLANLHTFAAARFARLAHRVQHRQNEEAQSRGRSASPSLRAEALHFLGEVEVVFGLWAVVLVVATTAYAGWEAPRYYVSETVNYTEPLFVVVIMALESTRPVIGFAESALRRVAAAGGATSAAWWAVILAIGPVLGSFITEPAAMTICAVARAAILRPATLHATEVRDIGGVVRQRVDWWDADAVCGPAGADGGAPMGVGHPLHGREFRLARRHRHRRVDSGLLHPVPSGIGTSRM